MKAMVKFTAWGALLALWASEAAGQEYCVSCAEPSAVYRCTISGARPGLSQSLQVACITALAKEGRHSSCAVKRGTTVFECDGPVKTVVIGAETSPGNAEMPATVAAPPAPPVSDPQAPPATVLEAVKRAQKSTDEEVRKANAATATFFKRTFSCIGSLFTKCGQD